MKAESLGTRVRRLRMDRGLTLRALAKKANVSAPFMSDMEHGRRFPKASTMAALAKALRVPLRTLEEVRLTRDRCAMLERDPELLRALIKATEDSHVRAIILDAVELATPEVSP